MFIDAKFHYNYLYPMKQLPAYLESALEDYFIFLEKGYPQQASLKLVGDRYKLSRSERNMLYRGVSGSEESMLRKKKITGVKELIGGQLFVDGLNQLYTIAAYLDGNDVFISTDGFLRDSAAVHGTGSLNKHLERPISLIFEYTVKMKVSHPVFYIDSKVNHSDTIADKLKNVDITVNPFPEIILSDKVDQELRSQTTGIIATSDSQIIRKSVVPVFDLAHHVLSVYFTPDFIDLGFEIGKK